MTFETLTQLVADAEQEQAELDLAAEALEVAKNDLAAVQQQVAAKQADVDIARELAGKEKNDVVEKIQAVVSRCNEILTALQG